MKKFFLNILLLCIVVMNAMAVDVTITTNTTSRIITLKNKATGDFVDVGAMLTSPNYTYKFTADEGEYVLSAFQADGTTSNGTIDLTLNDEATQAFQFYTITAGATNSGWILGTDYTVECQVLGREGISRNLTIGTSTTANRITFLVYSGDTYYVQFIPSEHRATEGYLTFDGSGTVTANTSKTGAIPMGYSYTVTVPEGANFFMGKKNAHFQPFIEVLPTSQTLSNRNIVYDFKLAASQVYNYRVSQTGKVTRADKFTMTATLADLEITPEMLDGNPKEIQYEVAKNSGFNVANIFLNINEKGYLKLATGETHQIVNLRTWEIVDNITNNYFIEPDYHYTVINEDGNIDNSVITVNETGKISVVGNGTAIVLVTYDAINVLSGTGGPFFGAIWPENTGVFVVSVGANESGIASNMLINEALNTADQTNKVSGSAVDAELDVFYYTEQDGGYDYTFTPSENITSVTLAQPIIAANITNYDGFSTNGVTDNGDGSYTVRLIHGRNIVKLTSENGAEYQILTAKSMNYTVTNITNPGGEIQAGDQVSVLFDKIYHPCNKLAGVYNMAASVQYTANGNNISSKTNQYTFGSTVAARTITTTIPADWNVATDFDFTAGVIKVTGFGDPYGGHREITLEYGKNPNFTAVTRNAYFGALPTVSIRMFNEDVITDITPEGSDIKYSVYPNPFTEYIMVNAGSEQQAGIYNLSGQMVLNATLGVGSNRIDTSALPKGIYIFKCGSQSMKIVK